MWKVRRCRDVISGRKGLWLLWRGRTPDHGQRRKRETERDRQREVHRGLHRENTFPKSLFRKTRRAD